MLQTLVTTINFHILNVTDGDEPRLRKKKVFVKCWDSCMEVDHLYFFIYKSMDVTSKLR